MFKSRWAAIGFRNPLGIVRFSPETFVPYSVDPEKASYCYRPRFNMIGGIALQKKHERGYINNIFRHKALTEAFYYSKPNVYLKQKPWRRRYDFGGFTRDRKSWSY